MRLFLLLMPTPCASSELWFVANCSAETTPEGVSSHTRISSHLSEFHHARLKVTQRKTPNNKVVCT